MALAGEPKRQLASPSSAHMPRPPLPPELQRVEWLAPWRATEETLEDELGREVGTGHPLAGRPAHAVARRSDTDDVLFWLPAGPALLALVHLTWQGRRERDPRWPATELFASVDEWVMKVMRPDHADAGGPSGT